MDPDKNISQERYSIIPSSGKSQLGRIGRRENLSFLLIDGKRLSTSHDNEPDTDELSCCAAQPGYISPSVQGTVRMGAGYDKGRVLQWTASINFWIQEWRKALLDILKKLIIQPSFQSFQEILVGHMHEDGFIFQPSRWKGSYPTNAERLITQWFIWSIGFQISIKQLALFDLMIKRETLLLILQCFHLMHGSL